MKIYFAGIPSNHREQTLIEAKVACRLISFGGGGTHGRGQDAVYVMKKWDKVPEKEKK